MANALARETSPYLLQHKDNPVDWQPWGEDALRRAVDEDKPLLVSIGYSSCHWCHVMERESFEDAAVAAVMNERYVCVKVDREERPDVDALYMDAVQAMTGQGGWPLNVFLTPGQVPFYGGTYFPPESRHGMPAWTSVLEAVADAWRDQREEVLESGERLIAHLAQTARLSAPGGELPETALGAAVDVLRASFDSVQGGWGPAPKFPAASVIDFLLGHGEPRMALQTLRSMASGGIFDQVGGGFARYSTDATWTVPHFEKMLYDNALLARAYLHGWQVSGDALLRRTCEETLDWALREMRGPEGAFYSALDADSEGVEGKFYVWTLDELYAALGDDADAAIAWFGATEDGNFEGANIPESRGPEPPAEQRERIRATLLEARSRRVWPGLDDKRLTAWNALMIGALAEAGAVLEREDYLDAARAAAAFLLDTRLDGDRLRRTDHIDGFLEDHAFLLEALLALYEATFEPRWFDAARALADAAIARFADDERGGFFSTAADGPALLTRRKELQDAPIPSGGASMALGLLRLARLTGEHAYEERAVAQLGLSAALAGRHPTAFGHALQGIAFALATPREVAIAGEAPELAAVVRRTYRPHLVLAGGEGGPPLLDGREPVDGRPAAYVCERFSCRRPVTDPAALRELLA